MILNSIIIGAFSKLFALQSQGTENIYLGRKRSYDAAIRLPSHTTLSPITMSHSTPHCREPLIEDLQVVPRAPMRCLCSSSAFPLLKHDLHDFYLDIVISALKQFNLCHFWTSAIWPPVMLCVGKYGSLPKVDLDPEYSSV